MTTSRRTFLKAGLAGVSIGFARTGIGAETSGPVDDDESISSNLHELVGKIRLGPEFFLNKTATEESVRRHFRLMQSYGPTVAAILYNRKTLLLLELDGQTQQRTQEAVRSLTGCYEALRRRHVPATFIDIDELKPGGAGQYEVLYLP